MGMQRSVGRAEGLTAPAERLRPESMLALLACGYSEWYEAEGFADRQYRSLSSAVGAGFCRMRFVFGRIAPAYGSLVLQAETKGFVSISPALCAAYEEKIILPDRSRLAMSREERDLVSIHLFPPA